MGVVERYKKIKAICYAVCERLELEKLPYFLPWFNYGENVLYKMAGYNGMLDGILKIIESRGCKVWLLKLPLSGPIFLCKLRNKASYEFDLLKSQPIYNEREVGYFDNIFFATMNNYTNPFIEVIENNCISGKNLLILPGQYKKWINFRRLCKLKKCRVVTIEQIIGNYESDFLQIRKEILGVFKKKKKEILTLFEYQELSFGRSYSVVLEKILYNLFAFQVLFANRLFLFLKEVSFKNTQFYVARDRRAAENAFLQCAGYLNGNTNMLIHGMISLNHERRLWTDGSFSRVSKVYVLGFHDKLVIEERQRLVGEKCPEIVIGKLRFFEKVIRNQQLNELGIKNTILFAMQSDINPLFSQLVKIAYKFLPYKIVVRAHPENKNLIPMWKRYERENLIVDNLSGPIEILLPYTKIFITAYSTSALESIAYGIPVFFIDFKELVDYNVFRENDLTKEEEEVIFCNSFKDLVHKMYRLVHDRIFELKVKKVNLKLYKYFVGIPCEKNRGMK